MKVVLDTNVLVAAFIARGMCNELFEHCALRHEMVLSRAILDEFRAVLTKKFDFTREEARRAVALLRTRTILLAPNPLPQQVCRDADDDAVLATAIAGSCQCLITGDKDLLELDPYQGVRILPPSAFWGFETKVRRR